MVVLTSISTFILKVGVQHRKLTLFAMDSNHHHDDSNDEIEAIDNTQMYLFLFVLLSRRRRLRRAAPTPSHCRWTGQEVVDNLLNCRSPTRIHNQLRMKLDTFYSYGSI